jgi:hypothetical protein
MFWKLHSLILIKQIRSFLKNASHHMVMQVQVAGVQMNQNISAKSNFWKMNLNKSSRNNLHVMCDLWLILKLCKSYRNFHCVTNGVRAIFIFWHVFCNLNAIESAVCNVYITLVFIYNILSLKTFMLNFL